MSGGQPAVAITGLHFAYPDGTRALQGVDIAVAHGERVAIVGQNGSGKSTLVRHLNGLLRASAGEVVIDGRPVGRRHVAELARTVGISFQNPDRQIFAGSVGAEVAFGPRNMGLRGAELEGAVASALEMVGLSGERDSNPYDLGYSRRKLLAIASVLAMSTPIVVLDEPTTGQDAHGVRAVEALIGRLHGQGRTLIAISHDLRFVAESFERVVVMRAGRIVLDGPPVHVFGEESWPALRSTNLEPPYAARVGARMGLGSTPTEAHLMAGLAARSHG